MTARTYLQNKNKMKTKYQQETEAVLAMAAKLEIYEEYLEQLAMAVDVSNHAKVYDLLQKAQSYSYAHRSGNGEITDEQREDRIYEARKRLVE